MSGLTSDTKSARRARPGQNGTPVQVRLQPAALADLDTWRAAQNPEPSRPEAVRRLLRSALGPSGADGDGTVGSRSKLAGEEPIGETTPKYLIVGAAGFLMTAKAGAAVRLPDGQRLWPTVLVNVCYAIELSLKAFVLFRSKDYPRMLKMQHDLEIALREANACGLSKVTPDIAQLVRILNPLHRKPNLKYLRDWNYDVPDPDQAIELTADLHRQVSGELPIFMLADN